jgi:hypothetical protein
MKGTELNSDINLKLSRNINADVKDGGSCAAFESWLDSNHDKYILTERDIENIKNEHGLVLGLGIMLVFLWVGAFMKSEALNGNGFAIAAIFTLMFFFIVWYYMRDINRKIDDIRGGNYSAYILDVDNEKLLFEKNGYVGNAYYYYIRFGEFVIKIRSSKISKSWGQTAWFKSIRERILAVKFSRPDGNIICFYPCFDPNTSEFVPIKDGGRSAAFENWLGSDHEKYILTERDIKNMKKEPRRQAAVCFVWGLPLAFLSMYWMSPYGFHRGWEDIAVYAFLASFSFLFLFTALHYMTDINRKIADVRSGNYIAYIVRVKEKRCIKPEYSDAGNGRPFHRYYIRCGEFTVSLRPYKFSLGKTALFKSIRGRILAVKFRRPRGNIICFYPCDDSNKPKFVYSKA